MLQYRKTPRRAAWSLCALALASVAGQAAPDIHAEGAAARFDGEVDPVSQTPVDHAAGAFNQAGFEDEAIREMIPPLDQIPEMPMPEQFLKSNFEFEEDTAVVFDAETGAEWVLPAMRMKGITPTKGGDQFEGAVKFLAEDGFDVAPGTKWSGSLSTAGGLDSWPRSGNVKLAMRYVDQGGNDRWYVCSGAMNDAGVVVTAAHCVYARSPDGINIFDWAEEIYIFPGWDGNGDATLDSNDTDYVYQNFGVARGTFYQASNSWVNSGSVTYDVGLVRVNRFSSTGGRSVGMLTGWYAWTYGGDCTDYTWSNFSYPAEGCGGGLHNGRDMYYWFGRPDSCPDNRMQLNTSGGCFGAVWGGMSGSNMYRIEGDNRYVGAACSTSNRNDRAHYARLWETFVNDMQGFENDTRGSTFDPELLRYRYSDDTDNKTVKAGTATPGMKVLVANATNNNPAARDFVVDIYLSTNNNISTGDRLIATWNYNWNFGAMSSVTFNIPATTIPADVTPGNYWIGANLRSTSGEATTANNETDTWDASRITVTLANPATPSYVSPANFSTEVSPNANLDWSTTARATSYDVYFGTDPTPDFGEYQGNTGSSFWSLPTLNLGTTYYWQIVARNSAGSTAGPVYRFTVEQPVFDLSARLISTPGGTVAQGTTVPVNLQVANSGNTSSGSYTVDVYLSTNTTISTFDTRVATVNYGSLTNGSTRTTNGLNVTVPVTQNPGTYYVGMIVNGAGDSNTSNNTDYARSTISVVDCPADVARPYGTLDIDDVLTFLQAFDAGSSLADLAPPSGVYNIDDILTFLTAFNAGCP